MSDYIDSGDRVVVTGNARVLGSDNLTDHQGKHGLVIGNDGWGKCSVQLDDGSYITAWNDADLTRE